LESQSVEQDHKIFTSPPVISVVEASSAYVRCVLSLMKTVTLEEHFVTRDFQKATAGNGANTPPNMQHLQAQLLDLGAGRIRAMDEGGVGLQVLSLAAMGGNTLSPSDQTAIFRGVHDELVSAIHAYPDRLKAFCTPALKEPANAVRELERTLALPGFVGVLFNGTTEGKFLDAPEFFPVLEAAAALKVPVYIHPAPPPEVVYAAYYSGLPGDTGHLLSIAGWGWHSETAVHVLRLILGGTFDRLPQLQVIIGHMGEGIPYALARTNGVLMSGAKHLERSIVEVFQQQVYVTTSGYFTKPPFDCAREVLGLDRLMYSVDYPFSPTTKGRDFLTTLDLSEPDLAKLTHGNAEKVLKL
jgi:predicted TIM-barrel fold metal-dependent hydrolase